MSTIVTRASKGALLTHAELDSNFTNLNTDKLELVAGTKMAFYQLSAPVGWTIDPTITTVGMMVIDQAAGGATGGTDDPLLNNKIPSHTHTMQSAGGHTHTYWNKTGYEGSTQSNTGGSFVTAGSFTGTSSQTGAINNDGTHTHVIDANTGANWTPIYHKFIICSKN